jgi:uncharacterized protein
MKRITVVLALLFLAANSLLAADVKFPAPTGFINDYAGVLAAGEKQRLEKVVADLKAKTGDELAVAIVKTVEPLDPKLYAVKLFESWKIGQKGKDNGLLILLAMDERRIEIEVGYGLEGIINDAKAGAILDQYAIPSFKEGKYGEGLYNTAAALAVRLAEASSQELGGEYADYQKSTNQDEGWLGFIITAVIMLIVLSVFTSGTGSGLAGGFFGAIFGYSVAGLIGAILGAILGFVLSFMKFPYSGKFGGGWSSWGGGWSGGGGSGGFGGFGGGGSGGGGSGRSW